MIAQEGGRRKFEHRQMKGLPATGDIAGNRNGYEKTAISLMEVVTLVTNNGT
jgi:hypothetical protein